MQAHHARVELPERVVRAAAVGKDLGALQRERDVRGVGREELLARLVGQRRVGGLHNEDAKGHGALPGGVLDRGRQHVLVELVQPRPGREPPRLAVVPVVGHVDLWADADDLAVEQPHAAVVAHAVVEHGHANVEQDVVRVCALENLLDAFPAVRVRVALEKVVFAAIAADLIFS